MSLPVVSVIIPLFNRADMVQETLDSLVKQTFERWEVIVVDDESTDGGATRVEERGQQDSRIRCIRRNTIERGASVCRNLGVSAARGEFVVFLDSDDCLGPDALERRCADIQEHHELDFIVYQGELFEKLPGDLGLLWNIRKNNTCSLDRFLTHDVPWNISSPVWRKSKFLRLSGFNETLPFAQDWEVHIRALASGLKYVWCDRVDHYIRVATGGRDTITTRSINASLVSQRTQLWKLVAETLLTSSACNDQRRKLLQSTFLHLANELCRVHDLNTAIELLYWVNAQGIFSDHDVAAGKRFVRRRQMVRMLPFGEGIELVLGKVLTQLRTRSLVTLNHSCVPLSRIEAARRPTRGNS